MLSIFISFRKLKFKLSMISKKKKNILKYYKWRYSYELSPIKNDIISGKSITNTTERKEIKGKIDNLKKLPHDYER